MDNGKVGSVVHPVDRIAAENIVALSEIREACIYKDQCDFWLDNYSVPERCQYCTEELQNVFNTNDD